VSHIPSINIVLLTRYILDIRHIFLVLGIFCVSHIFCISRIFRVTFPFDEYRVSNSIEASYASHIPCTRVLVTFCIGHIYRKCDTENVTSMNIASVTR